MAKMSSLYTLAIDDDFASLSEYLLAKQEVLKHWSMTPRDQTVVKLVSGFTPYLGINVKKHVENLSILNYNVLFMYKSIYSSVILLQKSANISDRTHVKRGINSKGRTVTLCSTDCNHCPSVFYQKLQFKMFQDATLCIIDIMHSQFGRHWDFQFL